MDDNHKLVDQAIVMAVAAHSGQVDKGGKSYIFHPLRMMLKMDTIEEKIVAILHDVIEDTFWSMNDIKYWNDDPVVLNAIAAMTHESGVSYFDYIDIVNANPIARKVKLADLQDNMDLSRIPNPTQKDFTRIEKYKKAQAILLGYKPVEWRSK